MNKLIPIFLLLALRPNLASSSIKLEVLSTGSTYNYFALPPGSGNRIDLPDTSKSGAFRVFYEKGYKDWSWTLLYAPLELEYNFTSTKSFNFNSTTFTTNTTTKVNYKFNSYRLGYRRIHRFNNSRFYYGGLLKIRDAEICVTQNNNSDCYDNIGAVPLLNVGFDANGDNFYLATNIDGLYSSKGSAYDFNIEVGIQLKAMKIGFGARRLGGGADNETVTNFGAFQSYYMSIIL